MSVFLFHLVRLFARWERWVLGVLFLLFLSSFSILLARFYEQNTARVPSSGGTYIEGSVGEVRLLIPWFTVANDVNRDIVSLLFSGLLRYNPTTKKIEDDLASLSVSADGRVYTCTLKDGLFWHDSTKENPHPVTADDVVFTFTTVQDPQFPNGLLRQNFRGVSIVSIDDRTVQFRLEKPYSFFPSNLTLGILPRRAFDGIPPKKLLQAVDVGLQPIGAGPYRFKSLVQTELSTEVTLERFPRSFDHASYYLDRIVFRIFPSYAILLSDVGNIDGIRLVPRGENGEFAAPRRFQMVRYTLPQYVALFFNLDRDVLSDPKLRLGLQLGTNKNDIQHALGEPVIVDTPFLAVSNDDWRYQYDPAAAQGALFASEWYYPEKLRLQQLLEEREANDVGILRIHPVVFLDTGALLTVTGTLKGIAPGFRLHGMHLERSQTLSGSWMIRLPTDASTGSLQLGNNLVRLTDPKGRVLDSAYVWRTADAEAYRRASEEQRLVQLFLTSRKGDVPPERRVTAVDLAMEHGFLRRRRPDDIVAPRVNRRGKRLSLSILTSDSPPQYRRIAESVAEQWKGLGVDVTVDVPDDRSTFEERLLRRDYDVLLFGQSLLDNLDGYSYWHSSGIQKHTVSRTDLRLDAYNLSQYASFEADTLLESVRGRSAEREQYTALRKLRDVLAEDVPAIFLYSPQYAFAYSKALRGVVLGDLSLHSDRFLSLAQWYVKERRVFLDGVNWFHFSPWRSG
ncbi:hypothetical protein HYT95_00040 [Candidatus Peregrinibacteria bacterium]|nr:hypothetical protein [Candidatus Peregrinibacteria bacterium]